MNVTIRQLVNLVMFIIDDTFDKPISFDHNTTPMVGTWAMDPCLPLDAFAGPSRAMPCQHISRQFQVILHECANVF